MLISDKRKIGDKLYSIRKKMGMTQAELAEAAKLSDRAYADIERGTANMRTETLLRICGVLHITPNEILTEESDAVNARQDELIARLISSSPKNRETALRLLEVYLQSLAE